MIVKKICISNPQVLSSLIFSMMLWYHAEFRQDENKNYPILYLILFSFKKNEVSQLAWVCRSLRGGTLDAKKLKKPLLMAQLLRLVMMTHIKFNTTTFSLKKNLLPCGGTYFLVAVGSWPHPGTQLACHVDAVHGSLNSTQPPHSAGKSATNQSKIISVLDPINVDSNTMCWQV